MSDPNEPAIEDLDATTEDAEGIVGGDMPTRGTQNAIQSKYKAADKAYNGIDQYLLG